MVDDRSENKGDDSNDTKEAEGYSFKSFMACNPPECYGDTDPKVAIRWIREMEQIFEVSECSGAQRVKYASRLFRDDALKWWNTLHTTLGRKAVYGWSWEDFVTKFREKFCPEASIDRVLEEFLVLKKGELSVEEYTKRFVDMLSFVGEVYATERSRVTQYAKGLPWQYEVEVKCATTLDEAITATRNVEDVERKKSMEEPTTNNKRKLKEKQTVNKKFRFHPNNPKSIDIQTIQCFKCGRLGHKAASCEVKEIREELSTLKDQKEVTRLTRILGRCFRITGEQAKETHDVVSSTLLLNSQPASILFDSGANYSFISHEFCKKLYIPLIPLSEEYVIEVATGEFVVIRDACRSCSLEVDGSMFTIELLPMGIKGFDVVVGMDWLGTNNAKILSGNKLVSLKRPNGEKVYVYGERRTRMQTIISMIKARKCLKEACESFLAYVLDGRKEKKKLEDVKVVGEFPDVFPEDLPGLL